MRLRDLTPAERRDVEQRRDAVREDLAGINAPWVPDEAAIAAAPFMDDYEPRRGGLFGLCWGHPAHGNDFVTSTPVVHQGAGWALTESGQLYVLGSPRPGQEERLNRVLSGRRGSGRPPQVIETEGPEFIEGDLSHLPTYRN